MIGWINRQRPIKPTLRGREGKQRLSCVRLMRLVRLDCCERCYQSRKTSKEAVVLIAKRGAGAKTQRGDQQRYGHRENFEKAANTKC